MAEGARRREKAERTMQIIAENKSLGLETANQLLRNCWVNFSRSANQHTHYRVIMSNLCGESIEVIEGSVLSVAEESPLINAITWNLRVFKFQYFVFKVILSFVISRRVRRDAYNDIEKKKLFSACSQIADWCPEDHQKTGQLSWQRGNSQPSSPRSCNFACVSKSPSLSSCSPLEEKSLHNPFIKLRLFELRTRYRYRKHWKWKFTRKPRVFQFYKTNNYPRYVFHIALFYFSNMRESLVNLLIQIGYLILRKKS